MCPSLYSRRQGPKWICLCNYIRLLSFCVIWYVNRYGQWQPMLSNTGNKELAWFPRWTRFSLLDDGCIMTETRCSISNAGVTAACYAIPGTRWAMNFIKWSGYAVNTRVNEMKTLNMFYLVIYWTQKVHNDCIFLCSLHCVPYKCSSASEVIAYLLC